MQQTGHNTRDSCAAQRTRRIGSALGGSVVVCACYLAGPVHGQADLNWINAAGGLFSDPLNWSPKGAGPPGPLDTARFNLGVEKESAYTVTIGGDWSCQSIVIDDDNVILDLDSFIFALDALDPADGLTIGSSPATSASLRIFDGELAAAKVSVATEPSGLGSLAADAGAVLSVSSELIVGHAGAGSLLLRDGGIVNGLTTRLGLSEDATGHVTVDGIASHLNLPEGLLSIGSDGDGTFNVTAGGKATALFVLVGHGAEANGALTVTGKGSLLETPLERLIIGQSGAGSLLISDGAVVNTGSFGSLGEGVGSTGTATVTDEGSSWNLGGLNIGRAADGELSVLSGADVLVAADTSLGTFDPGVGTLTVSGAGSTLITDAALHVGRLGHGALHVQAGGFVRATFARLASIGGASIGTVEVDGKDSHWQILNDLAIGGSGSAKMNITDGGRVTSALASLGTSIGGDGSVDISGMDIDGSPSLWENAGFLVVGDASSGSINVSGGGKLTCDGAAIGNNPADSSVHVRGPGSAWLNTGPLAVGEVSGHGTLEVLDGGNMTSQTSFIGIDPVLSGAVTIQGAASQWTDAGRIDVGYGGPGALAISAGASVTSALGFNAVASGSIGTLPAGSGAVIVTGAGSQWNATNGRLIVGQQGEGELTISQGGSVLSGAGTIGGESSATGSVTITDADSVWHCGSNLKIGEEGEGDLLVQNGGSAHAQSITIGPAGKLHGNGVVLLGDGTGTLINNGTVAPGVSAGTLEVEGEFIQTASGTLQIEFGNADAALHDVLSVQGNVSLAGSLELSVLKGFEPQGGRAFPIITIPEGKGVITGVFEQVPPADQYTITYEAQVVIISVAAHPCPADIAPESGDGEVNIDDLFAVIAAWGPCPDPCEPSTCIADIAPTGGDCTVGIDDLFTIIGAWGDCP